jgi:hypothetical protein
MYDGYLSNAEDDPEGAVPVIIKTVKGNGSVHAIALVCFSFSYCALHTFLFFSLQRTHQT